MSSWRVCGILQSMRRAFASMGLIASLGCASPAWACSFLELTYQSQQTFGEIQPPSKRASTYTNLDVSVVRTVVDSAQPERPSRASWDGEGHWIAFETVDVLAGSSEPLAPRYMPRVDDAFARARAEEAGQSVPFAKWDKNSFRTARSDDHASMTSCGPMAQAAVATDQLYLVTVWRGYRTFLPVTGSDDPLVKAYRNIVADQPSPAKRAPREYFSEMQGYVEFEVTECPVAPKKYNVGFEEFGLLPAPPGHGAFSRGAHGGSIEEVRTVDLVGYLRALEYWADDGEPRECRAGDHYLAVRHWDKADQPRLGSPMFTEGPLVYRYLPISGGMVRRTDVMSNIEITGPELIAVDDIKSWIRAANPNATPEADPELIAIYEQVAENL